MQHRLLPLLREIGDLKRVTSAGRPGSIAARAFAGAWDRLIDGRPTGEVAREVTAACLAATRLGDLDERSLASLGVPSPDVAAMRRAALTEIGEGRVEAGLLDAFRARCDAFPSFDGAAEPPPFVAALAAQPRAGATCPGKARIVLGPPENHAEHCLVVAVYAVLLAEPGTDLATVFLASLAHHFHNAAMPDAGYAGEMLLGTWLEAVMATATRAVLRDLPGALAAEVEAARGILADAETPEGRAFHAADVIDRVLEIEQHLVRSSVTMDDVLSDMALVHEGPVKPFHDRVLSQMGLA